ncbi:nitroreductase family protein [Halorubrum sp. DTA98]|uniref:nitroreductase family protein n=1 Tax=Halorubrum sp. DTA98 TaxID=3402163 RepID=UPI003AB09EC1
MIRNKLRRIVEYTPLYGRILLKTEYPITEYRLQQLSTDELLSILKHECHRIEKSIYNEIKEEKSEYYAEKKKRSEKVLELLESREHNQKEVISWATEILKKYDNLDEEFIKKKRREPDQLDWGAAEDTLQLVKSRRSVRVWADDQPSKEALESMANKMVEAATWAPNSGNRQAWRFKIITDDETKQLLRPIKEEHTIKAPLLVFIGMDSRVYGALGRNERSLYIDAGAAIMQMVLVGHSTGLGICWNHFADDLINSRDANKEAYDEFAQAMSIADYIAPIAIVAVGKAEYIPPIPSRPDTEAFKM